MPESTVKRSYTKKNTEYWTNRSLGNKNDATPQATTQSEYDATAGFDGQEHYTEQYYAKADCSVGPNSGYQTGSMGVPYDGRRAFPYLSAGLIPFEANGDYYSVASAIDLATRAYFNFAPARNVINMLADLSCSKIVLDTNNKALQSFVDTWTQTIGMEGFMRKYFLEYYRSGNVFIYKYNGRMNQENYEMFKALSSNDLFEASASTIKNPKIPIRYIILNPSQVYLQRGGMASNGYARMLSTFEIARLKNPQNEEDKQVFKDLPKPIQESVMKGAAFRYIFAPLEQDRFYYAFYRKQDYEPMAVPMIFPVLPDIEWKMALKAMDMSLTKTMEQVLLLITTGRPADQFNKASTAQNQAALQQLFKNQTIGRVLVADYTTKAEWKIPDLKDLLGVEKYNRVNEDIKEGLQYMFFGGDAKAAALQVKLQLMIEGLKEGRRAFLNDFFIPELVNVCKAMGFKSIPNARFEDINIQDKNVASRLYVQMAQAGFLTPEELTNAINTGLLPTAQESIRNQLKFKDLRDEGLYQPMVGGAIAAGANDGGEGRPKGASDNNGKQVGKSGLNKESKASYDNNDPASKYSIGAIALATNICKMNEFKAEVENVLAKNYKVKELNDAQISIAQTVAKNIILSQDVLSKDVSKEVKKEWKGVTNNYLANPIDVAKEVTASICEICAVFDTDEWNGVAVYKSQVSNNKKD